VNLKVVLTLDDSVALTRISVRSRQDLMKMHNVMHNIKPSLQHNLTYSSPILPRRRPSQIPRNPTSPLLQTRHLPYPLCPQVHRNGWRRHKIPPSKPQILSPTSPPPQPRHLPHNPRIHQNNLAQSQRSPTTSRKANYPREEKHQCQ